MLVIFNGQKLHDRRTSKKISQALLAYRAETTIRYIRDLEKGKKSNPSAALVFRLGNILDIPTGDLMLAQLEEDEIGS